jgi:hypothetical protein
LATIRPTQFNGRFKQLGEHSTLRREEEPLTPVEEFMTTHRGVLHNRKKVKVGMPKFKFLEK